MNVQPYCATSLRANESVMMFSLSNQRQRRIRADVAAINRQTGARVCGIACDQRQDIVAACAVGERRADELLQGGEVRHVPAPVSFRL